MRKWIIMGFVALSLLGSADTVSAGHHRHAHDQNWKWVGTGKQVEVQGGCWNHLDGHGVGKWC